MHRGLDGSGAQRLCNEVSTHVSGPGTLTTASPVPPEGAGLLSYQAKGYGVVDCGKGGGQGVDCTAGQPGAG